ncbi:hypothetical protein [Hoyosella subflava]|uniref:Uncharacterized protein n=1 Tax=Hoyosella subflava (strain DSM 45089 / JCM 17490 / NBRC 109087 / DQS3-9A1) TaxID=443218 RepID=F6EGJ8_HOYSD|nr:hypothetical protein [Hoyosella subflava]AEF41051.1 hypothetical protein AS9A_2604 [Hoyosella subflava DQS3-9A1]
MSPLSIARPLSYLRGQTVNFSPDDSGRNPRTGPGFTLEVLAHDAVPLRETHVRTAGTVTGLDVGRTTNIRFGSTMQHVKVRLTHHGRPANVAVLNFAGHVLLGKTMTVGAGIPEELAFHHTGIHSMEIIALEEDVLLSRLCFSRWPIPWW